MDRKKADLTEINKRFSRANSRLLYLLTVALAVLWFLPLRAVLDQGEERSWERVRSAQDYLYEWRLSRGLESNTEDDPWNTGLIGIEWSPITTTLGSLSSKRTATDPRWSVVTGRWFDRLGLSRGDRIAVYSSGSFPGLILNVLCAAEARGLEVSLVVSLGSSTWGANIPSMSWPVIGSVLRNAGFISTRSCFYTLGGGEELGAGLSPEGRAILKEAARESGVEIMEAGDLNEIIAMKVDLLREKNVKALVNIGGSASSLGTDEEILQLPGGLVLPSENADAGNGVIAGALKEGIPVIHFLNLRDLALETGVPFDSRPGRNISRWRTPVLSIAGIILFLLVTGRFRRWGKGGQGFEK